MATLMGRRRLVALFAGLSALFALVPASTAQTLPAYTAKAGMLPIGKDPGRPDAEIFHVAYTLKDADLSKRPAPRASSPSSAA
jgi:hypothetical protein